jgi:hypothetical protein
MNKSFLVLVIALVATFVPSAANAQSTFDPATGLGFASKGEVQTLLGLNNKGYQEKATSMKFKIVSYTETESEWDCIQTLNNGNINTREKSSEVVTKSMGIVTAVARERNQLTGHTLGGFSGALSNHTATHGQAAGTCPTGQVSANLITNAPTMRGVLSVDGVNLLHF